MAGILAYPLLTNNAKRKPPPGKRLAFFIVLQFGKEVN
jgi:hypothetical protein